MFQSPLSQPNLHSSMVIVKHSLFFSLVFSFILFTFQYGYSKTSAIIVLPVPVSKFTFQYGYSKTVYLDNCFITSITFTFQYGYSKTGEKIASV